MKENPIENPYRSPSAQSRKEKFQSQKLQIAPKTILKQVEYVRNQHIYYKEKRVPYIFSSVF